MAMHVVLGDGEMPKKELTETLADLWEKATADDEAFWFLVQAKAEPTATDRALMAWFKANDIYFETIGDGTEVDGIYDGAQETHEVKRLAPKVVNLLKSKPEDGESADVLALFVSDDPEAEEDRWLNETAQAAVDAGYTVFALNDGMVEVDLSDAAAAAEAEPAPAPAKKAAAKKAVAKKAAAPRAAEPEDGEQVYTREQLEEMTLDDLKTIASVRGISLPPRTRMPTYIDHILGEGKGEAAVEIETEIEAEGVAGIIETVSELELNAPAMLIVVMNGNVLSRAITTEEAMALAGL